VKDQDEGGKAGIIATALGYDTLVIARCAQRAVAIQLDYFVAALLAMSV